MSERIQDRLREIDADIAELRRELGPPTDDPQDFGDAGADLMARNEQQAMIETLEEERARLQAELDSSGS